MLLLERDPEPRSQRETGEPLAGIARFGQWIEVPDSGGDWQLLRVDVPTSAWGEARAALYKLPQLRLTVRLDDGSIARHRVHPGPLSVPFLLSPYLERGSVAQGWPGGPPARRVEAFSLTLPRGGSAAFADEIAYELTAVAPLTEGSPPLQR